MTPYSPHMTSLLQPANRLALATGFIGLICGVFYAIGGFFVDLFTIGLNEGTVLAFGALLGMPLLFGAAGWACGFLGGLLVRAIRAARD